MGGQADPDWHNQRPTFLHILFSTSKPPQCHLLIPNKFIPPHISNPGLAELRLILLGPEAFWHSPILAPPSARGSLYDFSRQANETVKKEAFQRGRRGGEARTY